MNCLNIFLVDDGGGKAKVGLKSGPREPKVVEPGLLGALSSSAIVPPRAKSLFSLLGTAESHGGFF